MPWPDFSELSFGYSFLREFERAHPDGRFPAAPDFISQAVEATAGYDVSVLSGSAPVFFQFKRSFVLTTGNAAEIKKKDFATLPLYRMHLRERDSYRQHRALEALESRGRSVFYITSQIQHADELSDCYRRREVLTRATAAIAPSEIDLPNFTDRHHITFAPDQSHFEVYSDQGERRGRRPRSWKLVEAYLSEQRASEKENRAALEDVVALLQHRSAAARGLADEFDDPVVKAAVLVFLVLDAHLAFFK